MKKFFLGIFIVVVLTISSQIFATESPIQKIYKIENYEWDEINRDYKNIGYGSAVLIGKNKIITNAHVILGDNDMPTGNYNLCISDTFDTAPKCKTSLKLLKYDKTNDLAILESTTDISLGNPVQTTDKKLDLGETVKVYGYPSNGGKTITLTEGKVSGFDNDHYKIDANIDAGNSGGGVFDKDGKFIGIPYVASVGYSTLGYVIPVNMIQDFIAGKGDILNYGKIDSKFLKYINKNNSNILTQKIDNPYIQFDGFQKNGFTLDINSEKLDSSASIYIFYSKNKKTTIVLGMPEIYGKKYINEVENIDKLKELFTTVVEKKNIILGGKKINKMIATIGKKKEDGTTDKNAISLFFSIENINYMISTENYKSEKKSISSALGLFIRNFKIKKNIPLIDKAHYTHIAGSFDIIPDMNMEKIIGAMSFRFDSNIWQRGFIKIKKSYDGAGKESFDQYTFEGFGKLIISNDIDGKIQAEIKKNILGIYYINLKNTEAPGKYTDIFYTKINNIIYTTTITFEISKKDSELEKKYYQFLDTMNFTGKLPFKSATVGKINESEIDMSTDAKVDQAPVLVSKTSDSITLTWNSTPLAYGYAIAYGEASVALSEDSDPVDYENRTEMLTGTTVTIDGLKPNTVYYFSVIGINKKGVESAYYSDEISIKTYP